MQRKDLGEGLIVWQSSLLLEHGVTHAFTSRHGGCSTGPRATLDLAGRGSREGEALAQAETNLNRVRKRLDIPEVTRTLLLHQVHGASIHHDDGTPMSWPPPKADILVSAHPDALLMVRVADCMPILIHDPHSGAVAAVHSGWRGTVARAPRAAAMALMTGHQADPSDLIAAIGPAIGTSAFEVGEEVAEAFRAEDMGAHVHQGQEKPHIDLFGAVWEDLVGAGLQPGNIDGAPLCTRSNVEDCFSYRRDGPDGGRMAAVILPPEVPRLQGGNQKSTAK